MNNNNKQNNKNHIKNKINSLFSRRESPLSSDQFILSKYNYSINNPFNELLGIKNENKDRIIDKRQSLFEKSYTLNPFDISYDNNELNIELKNNHNGDSKTMNQISNNSHNNTNNNYNSNSLNINNNRIVTLLESGSSLFIWCLLLLPLLLSLLFGIYIPYQINRIYNQSSYINTTSDQCLISNNYNHIDCLYNINSDNNHNFLLSYNISNKVSTNPSLSKIKLYDYMIDSNNDSFISIKQVIHNPSNNITLYEHAYNYSNLMIYNQISSINILLIDRSKLILFQSLYPYINLNVSIETNLNLFNLELGYNNHVYQMYQLDLQLLTLVVCLYLLILSYKKFVNIATYKSVERSDSYDRLDTFDSIDIDEGSDKQSLFQSILPEQIYTYLAIVFIFIYLDLMKYIELLMIYFYPHFSNNVTLMCNRIRYIIAIISLQCILFNVLVFEVALQYSTTTNIKKTKNIFNKTKKQLNRLLVNKWFNNNDALDKKESLDQWMNTTDTAHRDMSYGSTYTNEINDPLKLYNNKLVSVSHPMSRYFYDFIGDKLIMVFMSVILLVFIYILLCNHTNSSSFSWYLYLNNIIVTITFLFWFILIYQSYNSTSRILRVSNYSNSRFQQICFRLLSSQLSIGSIGLLFVLILELFIWFNRFIITNPIKFLRYLFLFIQQTDHFHYLLYVDIYLMIIAILFIVCLLPIDISIKMNGITKNVSIKLISLERYLTDEIANDKIFCLETACKLMEMSYQSYFNMPSIISHTFNNQNIIHYSNNDMNPIEKSSLYNEPLKDINCEIGQQIDTNRLGINIIAAITNSYTNIFGMIGYDVSCNKLIICFRGSIVANLLTDLNFTQIVLPSFVRSSSYWIEIIDQELTNQDDRKISTDISSSVSSAGKADVSSVIEEENKFSDEFRYVNNYEYSEMSNTTSSNTNNTYRYLTDSLSLCKQTIPKVHNGFYEAFISIRSQYHHALVKSLIKYIQLRSANHDNNNSNDIATNIKFCGHSLGGALSVLAAFDYKVNEKKINRIIISKLNIQYNTKLSIYTFGSPRIGNIIFSNLINKLLGQSYYRIELDGDLVTILPKFLGIYKHSGMQILVDAKETGNLIIQPTVAEHILWRHERKSLLNHTLLKYRNSLEACFNETDLNEYLMKEITATNKENQTINIESIDWMTSQRGPNYC